MGEQLTEHTAIVSGVIENTRGVEVEFVGLAEVGSLAAVSGRLNFHRRPTWASVGARVTVAVDFHTKDDGEER